jgi:hypothetical protein
MPRRLLALALLAACGYVDYDTAPVGRFSGGLFVMWVGEGGASGDGAFVFVPNPRDPLTFTRANGREITPGMMYTDGGSIPRIGQVFNGFAPWGYAPAYMIHDWMFVAAQCRTDGIATKDELALADLSFADSAEIIAESIRTLVASGRVKPNDVAGTVISGAVAGPIARGRWTVRGACAASRVSEADRAAAEAAIPGSSKRLRGLARTLPDGETVPVEPATLVGSFSF